MIILCIDDEPIRYRALRQEAHKHGLVVVTTCRLPDVQEYLQGPDYIYGVCLDHDMPYVSGRYFAGILKEHNYPIVVTSLNPDGVRNICNDLEEYWVSHVAIPATDPDLAAKALAFFQKNQ